MNLKAQSETNTAKHPEGSANQAGIRYPSPFLTTIEAAEYLKVSRNYLQGLRTTGTGPAYLRVSARRVLYSIECLEAWLKANTHASTAEYPRAGER
jgi:hypothetical protein